MGSELSGSRQAQWSAFGGASGADTHGPLVSVCHKQTAAWVKLAVSVYGQPKKLFRSVTYNYHPETLALSSRRQFTSRGYGTCIGAAVTSSLGCAGHIPGMVC
jgi:hypothetical protein